MEQRNQLDRITHRPDLMGGKACIRNMRVTVGMVVNQVGAGHSFDEILRDYPCLEREDILQSLQYSARADWALSTLTSSDSAATAQ
jgi:uncharacterized protein (DUF433 family)